MRKAGGFTLIELLTVTAIIGLLASIVLASLSGARDSARVSAGKAFEVNSYNAVGDVLSAEWFFSECSGASAKDSSGRGNDATLVASWTTDSPYNTGCSLQFTATTNNATTPVTTILNTDFHTISFWIKFNFTSSYWGQILAYPAGTDRSPGIWTNAGGNCIHWKYDPGNTGIICGGPGGENTYFPTGKWYQVTGVKNGSSLKFYVNGALVDSASVANPKTAGTAAVSMGRTGVYNAPIIELDQVRIYGAALSEAEIKTLYAEGLPAHNFASR